MMPCVPETYPEFTRKYTLRGNLTSGQ
jgi:hypothetical protein